MFKPKIQNFNTKIKLQTRTEENIHGMTEISYPDAAKPWSSCLFKSKGGTEGEASGVITYSETAEITMWYRPDIKRNDRILLNGDADQAYDIISPVENIEMRNQFLMFKVQKVGG